MNCPALLAILGTIVSLAAVAQPPVPPPAPVTGLVREIGDGRILLSGGMVATLDPEAVVTTPEGEPKTIDDVKPGGLVEMYYRDTSTVSKLTLLPQLPKEWPLQRFEVRAGKLLPFNWLHGGRELSDSFRTASAQWTIYGCRQLTATVAYQPADAPAGKAVFRVLSADNEQRQTLWEQDIAAGQTAELECPLHGVNRLVLECVKPDGAPAADRDCIWGDPRVVLQAFEYIPVPPELSLEIARGLAERLGHMAGLTPVAVALPEVLGLSNDIAQDLRDDCLTALGQRVPVAGVLKTSVPLPPDEVRVQEAKAIGANSILVMRVRFSPPASIVVSVHLFTVEGCEEATTFEIRR